MKDTTLTDILIVHDVLKKYSEVIEKEKREKEKNECSC